MQRDPFYKKIVAELSSELNPETFELAVADLLRSSWPTLVPIKGGSDSGMDGGVGNFEGEPFPLVTTTSKDVIGNLTRNLTTYKNDGGQQKRVILATSQSLTPRRRKNLHQKAVSLGFTLIQIHDQTDLANRLYQSPKWCKELLNLEGDPAPISVVPKSSRPFYDQPVIGREEAIQWLKEVKGDSLLIGQPGSGKTFLLQQLTLREDYGLFVVSRNRGEIAAAVREHKPKILIVDDAHIEHNLLLDLKQLRDEIGADFIVLATCWPGEANAVADALLIAEKNVHTLDLLPRNDIVKVVQGVGIHDPSWLVREIVNQARGRPGLAVTLAHTCLQGGYNEFITAKLLSRTTLEAFKKLIGRDAAEILAAHAVGGDAGLPMSTVSEILGENLVEVRKTITKLAAGGVVLEKNENLVITPPALQHALIRDVFFSGATSLPHNIFENLLHKTPSLSDTAHAIFGARARGANVPFELLTFLVEETKLWEDFAYIGDNEINWLIERHPEVIVTIAKPALERVPRKALPLLLGKAVGDNRPLNSHPEHPLRQIEEWTRGLLPLGHELSQRRRLLFESVEEWLDKGGDIAVGVECLTYVFDPTFNIHESDPGAGMTIYFRHGSVNLENLTEIYKLWPRAVRLISRLEITDWASILRIVHDWLFGRLENRSKEEHEFTTTCAKEIIASLATIAKNHPGVLHSLRKDAVLAKVDVLIPCDEIFEILYPTERPNADWQAEEAKQLKRVSELAERWGYEPIEIIIERIRTIEKEAKLVNLNWPDYLGQVCFDLAGKVTNPLDWAIKMIEGEMNSSFVYPFLRKAIEMKDSRSWEIINHSLDATNYVSISVLLLLTRGETPPYLVSKALEKVSEVPRLARQLPYDPNNITHHVRRAFLEHSNRHVAVNAVEAETHNYVDGKLSGDLKSSYETALIRFARSNQDYYIGEAVRNNENLAYQWLCAIIQEDYPRFYLYHGALEKAVLALSSEKRRELIGQISDRWGFEELVNLLLRDDLEAYRALLKNPNLKKLHLIPLQGSPNELWVKKARIALDTGYSPEELVRATGHLFKYEWSGDESKYWQSWIDAFSNLLQDDDARIREIGKIGIKEKTHLRDKALREEKQEAIYG